MRIRWVFTLLFIVALMGSVFGAQSLGVYQTGQNITLQQSCSESTYSNISKVTWPNSTAAINIETVMTPDGGGTYSYVFNDTEPLGQYLVYGHCDEGGIDTVWVYDFEVTYSGDIVSLSNSVIVLTLLGLAIIFLVLSFSFKDEYWMLKSLFQFLSVLAGLISVQSAKIIASESQALGTMGDMGLLLITIVIALFFLWIFVKAFIEVIGIFKRKGDLRWSYD